MTAEDTVREYCTKYLKKYLVIEDQYVSRCLFVKQIFLDKMGYVMVLCNSIEILYNKDLHTEESIFHASYFDTLADEGKIMNEEGFTSLFRKRTFEMTDYLLKYIRRL